MKSLSFVTDAVAVAGFGAELNSGVLSVQLPYNIRILRVAQPTGVALANDADWTLWVNLASTGMTWVAELLDPINDGGVKLGPNGITITAGHSIQMAWAGQVAAQANAVTLFYEII